MHVWVSFYVNMNAASFIDFNLFSSKHVLESWLYREIISVLFTRALYVCNVCGHVPVCASCLLYICMCMCVSSYPCCLSWALEVLCCTLTPAMSPLAATSGIKPSESLSTLEETLPMVSACDSDYNGFLCVKYTLIFLFQSAPQVELSPTHTHIW